MTVKELIEELKKFPDDMIVKSWFSFDYRPVYKLKYDDEKQFIALRYLID